MSARVLIVEDDEDIARNLKDLLESEGHETEWARNGKKALEILTQSQKLPSLILLDLMMPVMDGFQFRVEQEKDSRLAHIPVVIMTADAQIESKKARIGAKAFLRKPIEIDDLLKAVRLYGA